MKAVEVTDRAAWDRRVSDSLWGHPLQLWGWGEAKRGNGWTAHRLEFEGAGLAQVLLWPVPRLGRKIAYVPRGPVVEPGSVQAKRLLDALVEWARDHGALYVRVEPAWARAGFGRGWRRARYQIQMAQTYTLDLRRTEGELLEAMSHKHRQYVRKAERDGVTVTRELGIDLAPMMALYAETAKRAGFGIHGGEYYERLHAELGEHSFLYYAHYAGRPVAFLWLAAAGVTAYELYGGVGAEGAEVRANYYLKWRAIADMKAAGYEVYDFNGRVTEGVARFKEGFGPAETDYVGTWDYPISLVGYHAWETLWPAVKVVGRRLARRRG